jgi:ABC-2 type transport system ATP-binding protein
MIQVRGLTKVFPGGPKAVDGLDLAVSQGEIFGLLGPNGAGKTTAIRTLSTLCGFDSGEVRVAGFDVDREPEKVRQAIGVVAQNTGIDYFLTGRENLELQGHLYRMKKAEIKSRIDELAKYFELEGSLDRQVAGYSGGMRRKLDIATALIHHPQLVFLDEPTLGLDIKSRKMLWTYIEKLNKEMGLTILLTTHYLEEADKLAHRVAIINGGKIRAVGTADELKSSIAGDALTLNLEQQDWAAEQFVHALKQTDYVRDSLWEGARKLHLYITNGAESVPKITELAGQYKVHILTLSLSRPSLDDVFLKYTGSSLEDVGESSGDEWWKQWAGKGGSSKWQKKWAQSQGEDGGEGGWGQWSAEEIAEWQKQQGQAGTESAGSAPDGTQTGGWGQWSAEEVAEWQRQQAQQGQATTTETVDSPPSEDVQESGSGWGQWSAEEIAEWHRQKNPAAKPAAEGTGAAAWGQWSAEEIAKWQKQQKPPAAEPEAPPADTAQSSTGGWGQWSAEEVAEWHRQRNQSAEQDPSQSDRPDWNDDMKAGSQKK